MDRRDFLTSTSGIAVLTAAGAATAQASGPDPRTANVERRIARLLQAYDAQGNHRTATPADTASAEWLVAELRLMGTAPRLEEFSLDRVDPQAAYLQVASGRIDGVPAFDAAFTGPEGIHGRLGPLGSDAEIAVVESDPYVLLEPQREQRSAVAAARAGKHKAVVVLTRGPTPGLYLLNAISFLKPSGPPMLQVSSVEAPRIKALASEGAEALLVAEVLRTPARASNVVVLVEGKDRDLAPVVVSTPRSGWWQCTGERGGGIACWVETVRAAAGGTPDRDLLFAAFSGHEVGFIGIEDYVLRRPGLYKKAHAWIHIGANVGIAHQPNLVTASDDSLRQWLANAFAAEGAAIDHVAGPDARVRGEAGAIRRGGARYLTIVGGTDFFHHPADRWPEAVDVGALAAYARGFAGGVLRLSRR
jgi:hypothetical protein